ncbi:MAG: flagellar basal body rod C-terminal domain-containing protein, partial [Lysobacteraceae bacterium]
GGRFGSVQAASRALVRGAAGLRRAARGAPPPVPATGPSLTAGALEGSNVDATGMLVSMIQLARQFETQVRLLHTEDQNAQTANSLLSSR